MNTTKISRVGTALALVSVVAISVLLVRDHLVNGKRGPELHQQALREFAVIKPPQRVSQLSSRDNFSAVEPGKVLVGATYHTILSYSEIRAHYDAELKSHGWGVVEERKLTDWWRDLGGRTVRYCKGPLSCSLEYAGAKAQYGWTYALTVTWGLDDCR